MKEGLEISSAWEKEPKKIFVEIGPNDRPLVWRLNGDDKHASYIVEGKSLFDIESGDMLCAVDLLPDRNLDVWRREIREPDVVWSDKERMKSHLTEIKRQLDQRLPRGVRGEVLHADAQKLPFGDGQIDTLFMANVLGGHVKDDQLLGFKAGKKHILREKQNLIKETKRVLKIGGKLIIEEEYAPASSVEAAYKKVISDLEHDHEFNFRNFLNDQYENGRLVLELTKREFDQGAA